MLVRNQSCKQSIWIGLLTELGWARPGCAEADETAPIRETRVRATAVLTDQPASLQEFSRIGIHGRVSRSFGIILSGLGIPYGAHMHAEESMVGSCLVVALGCPGILQ
jgi:hypothetical protein